VNAQKSAVLGIDLGSQYFKVAVIKTGGFDTVMNENSKRKSPIAVGVVNGERLLHDGAYGQKTKVPKLVLQGMREMIGRPFDAKAHEQGQFATYHFPYTFKKDEKRGTVIYDVDGTLWSPEELMGMIFHSIKDMSQKHIESTVTECVVTVPPYLTEHERRLIIDAAQIVDLQVIMLVNDNTAVAVRYGIEKPLAAGEEKNVLFVDVGASHTAATVTRYAERNITSYKKVRGVEILSTAWDHVGGQDMDAVLTKHFADEFDKKHNKKIHENLRAISKLRKDTEKVKTVLSANKETVFSVESLMDDVDFRTKIDRATFEDLNKETFGKIETVVKIAIQKSGLELKDIHEVIPFGAATRSPKIKELVLKATEREVWQPAINTDEAGCLGAAFVAANFSKSFRLREFHVYDQFPFSVGIEILGSKATIFKPGSAMEAKKTITKALTDEVKEADLVEVTLKYDDEKVLPAGTPTGLATYRISGMKAALEKLNVTDTPKVAVAVALHRDGIVDVVHASLKAYSMDWVTKQRWVKKNVTAEEEVRVPLNETNSTNTTDSKEDSETDSKEEEKEEKKEEEKEKEEEENKEEEKKDEESNKTNSSSNTTKKAKKKTKKKNYTTITKNVTREKTVEVSEEKLEKKLHTVALFVNRTHDGVPALSEEDFKAAQERHLNFTAEENERAGRADAKNDVEAFIFGAREKLSQDGMDTVSTEEQRSEISSLLEKAEDWLWEEGDNVETSVYKDKKKELQKVVGDVFYRFSEIERRESAISHFKSVITDARTRVTDWETREEKRIAKNESTWVHKNETTKVATMCDEAEKWLVDNEEELKKVGLLEKPPFSASEVVQYIKGVEKEVAYLRYKPKPRTKKPKKTKNATANGTNSSNTTSNTSSEESANASANETKISEDADKKMEEEDKEEDKQKEEL